MMKFFYKCLRWFFFAVIARFIVLILIGLNIRHGERLPKTAPAIIVANHNSHLDTLVLISLFPMKLLSKIHPVAAADYFLKNKFLAWFSLNIIGIIPIERRGKGATKTDPLIPCYQALERGELLILFPEGTRGEPEKLSEFKKGVAYIAEKFPNVPIIPIYMHGLGKSLPRGDSLFVPFFCDIFVGEPITAQTDKAAFMATLNNQFKHLVDEGHYGEWL